MKKEIEVSAKTREEAIAKAVAELGAPNESALFITVVNEGRKGFLGLGAVDYTIKAIYQIPDAPAEKFERREKRNDRKPRNSRAQAQNTPDESQATENENENEQEHLPGELPAAKAKKQRQRKVYDNIDPADAPEGARIAYDFITNLVANMSLSDVAIAMHEGDNDDFVITVDGDAAGVLIGHHGDTLDSLQYLANLAANNRNEEGEKRAYVRITVDVEDYRAKREDALRALARKKVAQVKKYKKSVMLEPMNPYERRIIHSEIQHIEGVSTNSIGVENNRRIVIFLEEDGMPEETVAAEKPARSKSRRGGKKKKASVDPLATSTRRQPMESTFSDDDVKDPFDIDLSAATYSEDEDSDQNE